MRVLSQAFGAVAPARKSSQKRFTVVLAAAAMAMAITALVLLASGSSVPPRLLQHPLLALPLLTPFLCIARLVAWSRLPPRRSSPDTD